MFWWLLAVAVVILVWGMLWRTNVMLAFGVLIGLPLAWIASRLINPYVTGMEEIPLWLPPLPFAVVATILLVCGALIWFRADKLGPVDDAAADHSADHSADH